MSKQDLTEYGDGELSLHVFNDENLYSQRHSPSIIRLVQECFTYTSAQLEELLQDIEDDFEEGQE